MCALSMSYTDPEAEWEAIITCWTSTAGPFTCFWFIDRYVVSQKLCSLAYMCNTESTVMMMLRTIVKIRLLHFVFFVILQLLLLRCCVYRVCFVCFM